MAPKKMLFFRTPLTADPSAGEEACDAVGSPEQRIGRSLRRPPPELPAHLLGRLAQHLAHDFLPLPRLSLELLLLAEEGSTLLLAQLARTRPTGVGLSRPLLPPPLRLLPLRLPLRAATKARSEAKRRAKWPGSHPAEPAWHAERPPRAGTARQLALLNGGPPIRVHRRRAHFHSAVRPLHNLLLHLRETAEAAASPAGEAGAAEAGATEAAHHLPEEPLSVFVGEAPASVHSAEAMRTAREAAASRRATRAAAAAAQLGVGLGNILESTLRALAVVRIPVGVVLEGELSVRTLNLFIRCSRPDSKHFVRIAPARRAQGSVRRRREEQPTRSHRPSAAESQQHPVAPDFAATRRKVQTST